MSQSSCYYTGKNDFYFKDIIKLMEENPELEMINKDIKKKKVRE